MFKDKDTKSYKDLSDAYKRLIKKLTFSSRIKKESVSINWRVNIELVIFIFVKIT